MFDYNSIWNPITIKPDHTLDLCLGPLHLWIHRGKQEWHVAHEHDAHAEDRFSAAVSADGFVPGKGWVRWMINDDIDEIQLGPRLPDRPLIVRPEMPMCLLPKQSVQFFVGIPMWLSISFGPRHPHAAEIPTLPLSNSWFGPVTEGELCYALKTTAKLHQEDLLPHAHRAGFALEIRNTSDEKLNFERLCLHTQYLNIYRGQKRLWTNKGRVSYRGEEHWSRIVYTRNAPDFEPKAQLLGTAREPLQRGTLKKTFDNLKQLAEF
ncbi:MAG: DUF432 domain-containing protein [Kiritimatiellales bacterium]|nr:DUF432 domain-containing protein [Kiritimatiellales bacterium]MCF7864370.1 DUF432 domain-containing protein [Kiritimatiellales bacterium]